MTAGETPRPREHRYCLLLVLRPELAMLYDGAPIKFVGAHGRIDQNAWALLWQPQPPVASCCALQVGFARPSVLIPRTSHRTRI